MILFRKIANVFLATVLLLATTGVTLSKHYCLGKLKSVAVNEHAPHCFKGEEEKTPCCEDVTQELRVNEITKNSFDFKIDPDFNQLATITWLLIDQDLITLTQERPQFAYYEPPPLEKDVPLLFQSFLI